MSVTRQFWSLTLLHSILHVLAVLFYNLLTFCLPEIQINTYAHWDDEVPDIGDLKK